MFSVKFLVSFNGILKIVPFSLDTLASNFKLSPGPAIEISPETKAVP